MTRQMTITEVKAKLLALVNEVEKGEEIEITRYGHIVARIVPARHHKVLGGKFTGVAVSVEDDEQLYSTGETWNAQ